MFRFLSITTSFIVFLLVSVSLAAEHFVPITSYRTGPYGVNGAPAANGFVDYLKMINARDGGVGGVKLAWEECETAYKPDRFIECYERLGLYAVSHSSQANLTPPTPPSRALIIFK
jgi:hypothetical protein